MPVACSASALGLRLLPLKLKRTAAQYARREAGGRPPCRCPGGIFSDLPAPTTGICRQAARIKAAPFKVRRRLERTVTTAGSVVATTWWLPPWPRARTRLPVSTATWAHLLDTYSSVEECRHQVRSEAPRKVFSSGAGKWLAEYRNALASKARPRTPGAFYSARRPPGDSSKPAGAQIRCRRYLVVVGTHRT